jgi:hypothetical protein
MNNNTFLRPLALPSRNPKRTIASGIQKAPRHRMVSMLVAGALVTTMVPMALTGCGSTATSSTGSSTATTQVSSSQTTSSIDLSAYDLEYTDRDCDPSYDESSATKITLSGTTATTSSTDGVSISGSTVTITKEGVYVVSGTLTDGQIVVDCNEEDKAKVQIVLKDANISCSSGSAIYVQEAKKVFLTLDAGTTNTVSDGSTYTLNQDDGSANACIYSKSNLTIQGTGALTVNGNYRHGIFSKDDLVITGGTLNVTSKEDAVRGKDCLKIKDGSFTINSGEDALKSSNSDEDGKGYVVIDGGTFAIAAGDDAIHAEKLTLINNGTIDISTCYEGLEGQTVVVNGGTTHLVASDDGVNAASGGTGDSQAADFGGAGQNHMQNIQNNGGIAADGSTPPSMGGGFAGGDQGQGGQSSGSGADVATATTTASYTTSTATTTTVAGGVVGGGGMMDGDSSCVFQMNGGYLEIDASGDGVDSNGSVEITGGVLLVSGPTSDGDGAFDYALSASISGGTVIMAGSVGMAQSFSSGSQAFSLVNASGSANQSIAVTDSTGKVLASYTPSKQYNCVLVSTTGMTDATSYSIVLGGTVSGANSDGYVTSGTVSGGSSVSFTASTSDTSNSVGNGMPNGMGGGFSGGAGGAGGQATPGDGGAGGQAAPSSAGNAGAASSGRSA